MTTCGSCKASYADSALFCPNCGTPKVREIASNGDPLVGKVLGERFQVLELIGQGGSGTIYRAEHVTLRRKVAIKVLHNELSRDDLAVERFRREATTVAEIDNEHIVEIHDFGRTPDGRLYLAMELLDGETLDNTLVREKQLSVERAADILIQVGEALMEAHAIGYVHRDLRPRNIYLAVRRGKANFVKLLDFGLAKLVEGDAQAASTSLGMTFGDPRYMSPEQARGDRIDRRADIYQLGCIAYEMLTGAPPFTGNRVFDILSKQVTEIPAPLPTRRPGVPLWMEAAVAKMLAKDPENRFATTTRLVEALRLGLETGQVMEDEIARRRESIPPPSVSRVMQKMGIPAPVDQPVLAKDTLKGHLEPGHTPAAPPQPVIGKQTMKGHMEGPLPVVADPTTNERRRTGTPQLGVPEVQPPVAGQIEPRSAAPVFVEPRSAPAVPVPPVVTAAPASPSPLSGPPAMPPPAVSAAPAMPPAPVSTPPAPVATPPVPHEPEFVRSPSVAADAVPAGRAKRPTNPSESNAWFEDGERASEEADAIRARRVISPSTTDLSLYDDTLPQRRRWPLVVGTLAVLGLIGGTIAFALTRDNDKPKPQTAEATPAIAPTPPPTDVPPSQIISPPSTPPAATPPPPVAKTQPAAAKDTKKGTTAPATHKSGSTKTAKVDTGSDDTASRRPGGSFFGGTPANTSTTTTPVTTTPVTTTPPKPTGVSGADGPVDPYGGGDTPPPDGSGDKKAEFYANVGTQQLAQNDTAGAAASYKKALELDPKNVTSVIGMGEIALRQGLFGDAIAHLKKAAKLAPKSSRVFTLLGEAYLNSGNNAVAAENFKKALQLDPDNTRAREGFNEASAKVPPPEDDSN